MARAKKKNKKLPNGFGSIRHMSGNRKNPYAVYPPVTAWKEDTGSPITPPALCYVDTWQKGFAVLTAYNAGSYYPGYENTIPSAVMSQREENELVTFILSDYQRLRYSMGKQTHSVGPTFKQTYDEWYADKFREGGKTYSKATLSAYSHAAELCAPINDKLIANLRHEDLQGLIDSLDGYSVSYVKSAKNVIKQVFAFAELREYIDKDVSAKVTVRRDDDTQHGEAFTDAELRWLWSMVDADTVCELLIIMIYSGFRVSAYETIEVNLEEGYFRGGVKTASGKNRIVPIHSAIYPLVERRIARDGAILVKKVPAIKQDIRRIMKAHNMEHSAHDTRHTFSMLCERYEVREADRKRLMGHSFGGDLTNGTYGHRSVEELRTEIEKIQV